jgi:hypothetical protein
LNLVTKFTGQQSRNGKNRIYFRFRHYPIFTRTSKIENMRIKQVIFYLANEKRFMNLYRLLTFHAIITLAAALVLIFAPAGIPATVGIKVEKDQFLLCYFLAAAEIAIAYLSFYGRKISDPEFIHLIVVTMIIFHASTLLLESYAMAKGLSNKILANIFARILIIGLFYYYGIMKLSAIAARKPKQKI